MAILRILVPESTINYVQNPAMRYDTTGWTAKGATISRVLTYAIVKIASLKIVTNGTSLNEGAYYRVNALQNINDPITASIYVRGQGRVRIRLIDNPNGKEWASKPHALRSDRWTRISVTGRATGSNDMRLYVETYGSAAQAVTFYADGAQMERKAYATSYCDGDQEGCRWSGQSHASNSSRSAYTRAGGRWVDLASPEQQEKNLYMTVVGGLGMAPITNILKSFSVLPGSYFQSVKVNNRPITFTFYATNPSIFRKKPVSLDELHRLRQLLIDVIKPDKTVGGEEIIFQYSDGEFTLFFKARYEAGLEGEWDIRNRWTNSFPLRVVAVSPYLTEDDQEVSPLSFQGSAFFNNVAGRVDGQWTNLNYGFNGDINDFAIGKRGEIIAAGAFTVGNNSLLAANPLASILRIAYWDGTQWNPYGTGANGAINDIAVAPNGDVYVTGAFTQIGGVAANRVAYWNGSAWNAMSTGLNSDGLAIKIAPNGDVYVGGKFTTAGGVSASYIAKWTGAAWYSIGGYAGLNNYVYTIAISADGNTLYAGGAFTDQATSPGSGLTRVTSFNILTGLFSAMGSGFNATVNELILSPTNILYAGGAFTASGSDTIQYISQWNGATWVGLGAGTNSTVDSMSISPTGDLVVVGNFSQAGSVAVNRIALWNGSTWVNLDVNVGVGTPGGLEIYAVQFTANGDLYIGGTNLSTAGVYQSQYSGISYVTNVGSAEVAPSIYILGPATLKWIENQTSKKRMFFNLQVLSGEEVFIDFSKASILSTLRGNLSSFIFAGSDFRSFSLMPGENKLAALMTNDVAASMQISYVPKHWSMDATERAEEL